jgi:predicted nucleotidyltransferase
MKYEKLTEELKLKLVDLSKKYKLKLLILFGSRAKGNYTENSDWDFAFLPKSGFTFEQEESLFNDLMKILDYEKIDLININKPKNYIIIKNIFFEGKLIYENKIGLFTDMKWNSWITYLDFKKYYDKRFELTKKELENMI